MKKRYYKRKKKTDAISELVYGLVVFGILSYFFGDKSVLIKVIFGGFLFLLLGSIVFQFYKKYKTNNFYLKSRIQEIDKMSGIEFEKFLKVHFEKQGYYVKLTPASNDYGADLILKKDNIVTVVQAKRHKGKIGNNAIQEIVGAKGYYNATQGMVITNSFYTSNAIALASANNIKLWNRNNLVKEFQINQKFSSPT